MKELVLSLLPLRAHTEPARTSVVELLYERERLAEQEAEAALNGLRAVRLEYDPRAAPDRRRKLDSINARIATQQEAIAALKGSLANG